MRKTKIVCTLGPATTGQAALEELIRAGMDVARLNFSHGTHDEHERMYRDLRAAAKAIGKPVAVLGDLSGPKIRTGRMRDGGVTLEDGAAVTLVQCDEEGTAARVPHNYPPLAKEIREGGRILLDDGLLELRVEATGGETVHARVVNGGVLRDHKGINLPGVPLSAPALTEKDLDDLTFAESLGVDYVALSFVRRSGDVRRAKEAAGSVPVIAKIEKAEAIDDLGAILDAADGVMVARGDLGVEIGHEKVPMLQKAIIEGANLRAKPVITATQMLNSMIDQPQPTRAEVSDVANAVLDGTDAVMLSGETSVGRFPVRAVRTMDAIVREVEGSDQYAVRVARPRFVEKSFSNAVAVAAAKAAAELGLTAIAAYTHSGRSAALVSAHRPAAAVIALARRETILNRLALFWGVVPVFAEWEMTIPSAVGIAQSEMVARGIAESGDRFAVAFGTRVGDSPLQTNTLTLWQVTEN